MFGSRRRAVAGPVPRVAAGVQRPRQPLRPQVQSQGLGPGGGTGPEGAGRNTLLHRVLGYVHQRGLPGRRKKLEAFIFLYTTAELKFVSLSFISVPNHIFSLQTFAQL